MKNELPMGISQWRNMGEKYGYFKFFENKAQDILEDKTIYKIRKQWFDKGWRACLNGIKNGIICTNCGKDKGDGTGMYRWCTDCLENE